MITILIANDEKRIREVLSDVLKKEGYAVSADGWSKNGAIRIDTAYPDNGVSTLTDKVIELEKSLYNEKKGVLYKAVLEKVERPMIEYVLDQTDGNQLKASRILGINRNTMRSKIKKLEIDVSRWKR